MCTWKRRFLAYICLYHMMLACCSLSRTEPVVRDHTTSNVAGIPSAFKKFGYANMTLMQNMESRAPFNFTMLPWKVIPERSTYLSKSIIDHHVNWSMIVVVKSHSGYANRRAIARKTWAAFKCLDGVRLETVFVVGRCSDSQSEMALLDENKKYGDILQIDTEEVYTDVGYKTLAGMQWVSQNFPPYWMYSSADDDMVPDLKKLHSDLEGLMTSGSKFELRNDTQSNFYHDVIPHLPFHCGFRLATGQKPGRKDCLKWCVDYDTYSIDRYPPFCHGGWYSLPVALVSNIYSVSRTLNYFRMDDVWITGLLRLAHFDEINIDHHFGLGKCDEMIGMWPKSPLAATHCQTEQRMINTWKGIHTKILEEASEYIRVAD